MHKQKQHLHYSPARNQRATRRQAKCIKQLYKQAQGKTADQFPISNHHTTYSAKDVKYLRAAGNYTRQKGLTGQRHLSIDELSVAAGPPTRVYCWWQRTRRRWCTRKEHENKPANEFSRQFSFYQNTLFALYDQMTGLQRNYLFFIQCTFLVLTPFTGHQLANCSPGANPLRLILISLCYSSEGILFTCRLLVRRITATKPNAVDLATSYQLVLSMATLFLFCFGMITVRMTR